MEKRQNRATSKHPYRGFSLREIDTVFLGLTVMLLAIGLIMLMSASYPSAYYEFGKPTYYIARQGRYAILGIVAMMTVAGTDYHRVKSIAKPLLLLSVLLLALVLIPGIGVVRNNARRWISVGGFLTFQPSEIAKLAVILDFSTSIAVKKDLMRTWRYGVKPYAVILILIAALMLGEPHLSGTVLIVGTGLIVLFVGGMQWKWIAVIVLLGSVAVGVLLSGIVPYGQSRIEMWRNPFVDAHGAGYQLSQSLIAIGSGGLTGLGFGKSRQKFLYLPEEHNDFIFAVVCEELGLLGSSMILLLFAAVIMRGYQISLYAPDRLGRLLVVGIVSLFAMQTFLNIAVVTGLLPTTGISLPFFSYGGTALFLQLIEMGIVLSVSGYRKHFEEQSFK